jgi:AcrR family transcriptional regulator
MLEAARALFTRDGYDHVGVRDVASVVGVDAALVIRYFGSKERLFAEAVAQGFDPGGYLEGERSGLGERLARSVLQKEKDDGGGYDPLLALLRSAPNERAAACCARASTSSSFIRLPGGWAASGPAKEPA